MSDTGPGADRHGANPSWSPSLSDSSLSRPDDQPPNPWSRQASRPDEPGGSGPASAPSAPPPAGPYAAPEPAGFEPVQPGFDPQPTPPYGAGVPGPTPYGGPVSAYVPPPGYGSPPPAYGSNPYEAPPYQPGYGGVSPYGVAPPSHPRASTAMVFGILGIVFAFSCGIGGFLGIPGIVIGRRARREIDAEPGRWTGRSQASAGIVTGIIGVVLAVLVTAFIVVALVAYAASGSY